MHESIERHGATPGSARRAPSPTPAPDTFLSSLQRGVDREGVAFGHGAGRAWQDFKRWLTEIKTVLQGLGRKRGTRVIELQSPEPRGTLLPAPLRVSHR